MISELLAFTLIKIKLFWRDPESIFWAVVFPIGISIALGLAFMNIKQTTLMIGVIGNTPAAQHIQFDPAARAQLEKELGTQLLWKEKGYASLEAARRELSRGTVALVLDPRQGRHYYFDPQNQEARSTYLMLERLYGAGCGARHQRRRDRIH